MTEPGRNKLLLEKEVRRGLWKQCLQENDIVEYLVCFKVLEKDLIMAEILEVNQCLVPMRICCMMQGTQSWCSVTT